MKLRRIACAFLAGLSSPAWAACGTNACGNVTITRLWAGTEGKVYVQISDSLAPLDCTPLNSEYMTLLRSDTNSDWIYATLLTSLTAAAGKLERIRIVEGSSGCTISYVWQKQQP